MTVPRTLLLVLLVLGHTAFASHYKGGTISSAWLPNGNIELKYQLYYRYKGSSPYVRCTNDLIQNGALISDPSGHNLDVYYCPAVSTTCRFQQKVSNYAFKCKSANLDDDWSLVENALVFSLNQTFNQSVYESIVFQASGGSNWASPNDNINAVWAHMSKRVLNNDRLNTAPVVSMFPILTLGKVSLSLLFSALFLLLLLPNLQNI